MNRKEYQEYLQSKHWKEISNQRRGLDGHRCRTCGTAGNLEVHHVYYDRLGHEFIEDLITLCHDCHSAVTKSIKERGIKQSGEVTAQNRIEPSYKWVEELGIDPKLYHHKPDRSWREQYKTKSTPPAPILFGKKKQELYE